MCAASIIETTHAHGELALRRLLHNPDLLVGEAVQLVDELVDLAVGGVDLALDDSSMVRSAGRLKLDIGGKYFLHQFEQPVVDTDMCSIRLVDSTDW